MREIILKRLQEIIKQESGFTKKEWERTYVSADIGGSHLTKHISNVVFEELND